MREFFTLREVASRARLSEKTVRRAIGCGDLVAYKVRGHWLVRELDFVAWVERGRSVPDEPAAPITLPVAPLKGSRDALRQIEAGAA